MEGLALGTSFHITYKESKEGLHEKEIDSLIYLINKSMSTYIPSSDISKINGGDSTIVVDDFFEEVFYKSKRIFEETDGAFDPTVGIVVNAWGFGPDGQIANLDSSQVNGLLKYVGFNKLSLEDGKIKKKYQEIYIDFNAIAKGYAVDVIGRYLEMKEMEHYLIEIGGEIRARGLNTKGKNWKIAIEQPNFDQSRSFQSIIELSNQSIATSGNYRKFKVDSITGEKYAHTMDAKTGYPSRSNLLSVSVISEEDCADVDAYATGMMAMGLQKSKIFLKRYPNLKAFLIYSEDGKTKTFGTNNLWLYKN